ncbi:hypothetical protein B0H17DRAFT_1102274 [Mycena rosella]|uniref:Uncharacterized protein n=1 Tax=Mycena rosella TaxID=1033263 RepID=A0AAD7G0G0_MYCRO|nr:hypothetical protein B0H17DRAFT_1102274 [Mycena rosella]
MSHYNTLLADRRHPPYFSEERAYYSTSGRATQWAPEVSSRTSHYIPTPASFVTPAWNAVNFTCQPEYNARSAPTYYSEASHRQPSSPPFLLDAISVYSPPFTRPASRASASDAYSTPYADADLTSPESSASPMPIKEEQPDDDGFIVDLFSAPQPQALAPPTEVPLRATQASPPMRRMMGVFRLNPFAMHAHGGRGVLAPWAGGEARPLEEEPRIFEFQLELAAEEEMDAPKLEEPFSAASLRAFSPDFDLEAEPQPEPEASWELAYPPLSFDPVATYPRALHAYNVRAAFSPTRPPC